MRSESSSSSDEDEVNFFASPKLIGNEDPDIHVEDQMLLFLPVAHNPMKEQGEQKNVNSEEKETLTTKGKKQVDMIKDRLEKSNKLKKEIIRSKNTYKAAHDILTNWCKTNEMEKNIRKYSHYYSRRIYFPLVLYEIQKRCKQNFTPIYERLAYSAIEKKKMQQKVAFELKSQSAHVTHLQKFISELKYSILACRQFMNGNIRESIVILHRRDRDEIYRKTEFQAAIDDFIAETGQPIKQ